MNPTGDQLIIFAVLLATLGMFLWNRWRYDVVALIALLVVALTGLVPPGAVFAGFGHPAVVTVAAVLVLSRGLMDAGVVDTIARFLTRVGDRSWVQVMTLCGIVTLCSGFMNNVGALALFMPVAIWMSRQSGRSPSFILMPLAFASLLGGLLTLIGTPPNIIIALFREETGLPPFGMFDFLPVGAGVAALGLVFITLAWRLTPRREEQPEEDPLDIGAYLAELRVPEDSQYAGQTLHHLVSAVEDEADVLVVGLVRDDKREEMPSVYKVLRASDTVLVEADSDSLKALIDVTGLELTAGEEDDEGHDGEEKTRTAGKDLTVIEAIVAPDSRLAGTTASALALRERYGINVLAVARRGHRLREQLRRIRFAVGDIVLVQAPEERLKPVLAELGCLSLASRGVRIARPRKVVLASSIFAAALVLIALEITGAAVGLVTGAVAMVLAGLIAPRDMYRAIDWPVIVLLAAMMPIGQALELTGGSKLIADGLLWLGQGAAPVVTMVMLMVAVMLLSNVINNAAAAVLAAPVALSLAGEMGVSPDPLLMAVAVAASCAFITPIGHQSNTLVMAPGGYRFGDYWRLGLPLSVLVIATAVPLILLVWGL